MSCRLRARFESMKESHTDTNRQSKVKVNRFVVST